MSNIKCWGIPDMAYINWRGYHDLPQDSKEKIRKGSHKKGQLRKLGILNKPCHKEFDEWVMKQK